MNQIRVIGFLGLALLTSTSSFAQRKNKNKAKEETVEQGPVLDTLVAPIPMNRQMFAERVNRAIKAIDAKDGSIDNVIEDKSEQKSKLLTQTYMVDAPQLLIKIENSTVPHQKKIGYEVALAEKLNNFKAYISDDIDAVYYRQLMQNFEGMLLADINGKALDFVKEHPDKYTFENVDLLRDNAEAKAYIYRYIGMKYPEMMMSHLGEIANEPYTNDIVAAAAQVAPRKVMDFAAINSKYRYIIARNPDKTVQTIVKIVDNSKSSYKVLQFLNQIVDGDKTIAQVDKDVQNDDTYFRSLVELEMSGKAISTKEIDKEISDVSARDFSRTVNALHESPDAVRFKVVENFDPEEYYFLLLGGETDEIYTSSYLGIFNRMMAKMGTKSGYELMKEVRMSKFRKFIRVAAGYNTLSRFLGTMTEEQRTELLHAFVSGLEKGSRDDLEDAVDVADAFGSISDEKLLAFLKNDVQENYERVYKDKSLSKNEQEKGVIVYGLLASIFNSSSDANSLQGAMKNIPPINYVDYSSLLNDSGVVIQQVFFYGDEDGAESYRSFLTNFTSKNWKVDASNPYWTVLSSSGEHPTVVYANKPLAEPKDEEAQQKLAAYLDANEIVPTVVIHRGHSYHLGGSLENLTPKVKIVMLGSCGGFHNLANVLDKAPDANIISTKQVGTRFVNEPIIKELNDDLLAGKNVDWISMWGDLKTYFDKRGADERDKFSDYIPPNRNLGAIFIKAYRKIELENQN